MFIDEAKIFVQGGAGGCGCVSLHHEKHMPKGGPDGGHGGKGANIFFVADKGLNTLFSFKNKIHYRAQNGNHGSGNNKTGKEGTDLFIKVPCGTVVYNCETNEIIADLINHGEETLIAKGGDGGRGNSAFATSHRKIPRFCERGGIGESFWLKLELKYIAGVGIIGFPNAGKSTFLGAISNADPKIASYPFTTKTPNLGVCRNEKGEPVIFADIPGLIEGAHQGAGLGHKFLRHIERTRVLLVVIDLDENCGISPLDQYNKLLQELEFYNPKLIMKPRVIVCNKIDLAGNLEEFEKLKNEFKDDIKVFSMSALLKNGVKEVLSEVLEKIDKAEDDYLPNEEDKRVVLKNIDNSLFFDIQVVDGVFRLSGKRVEELAERFDWNNEEARIYVDAIYKKMGVYNRLKKMDIKDGDVVAICDKEFNYYDDI